MAYCSQCGSPVPEGQSICSMCYGDISYGKDEYYNDYMQERMREEDFQNNGDNTFGDYEY